MEYVNFTCCSLYKVEGVTNVERVATLPGSAQMVSTAQISYKLTFVSSILCCTGLCYGTSFTQVGFFAFSKRDRSAWL